MQLTLTIGLTIHIVKEGRGVEVGKDRRVSFPTFFTFKIRELVGRRDQEQGVGGF